MCRVVSKFRVRRNEIAVATKNCGTNEKTRQTVGRLIFHIQHSASTHMDSTSFGASFSFGAARRLWNQTQTQPNASFDSELLEAFGHFRATLNSHKAPCYSCVQNSCRVDAWPIQVGDTSIFGEEGGYLSFQQPSLFSLNYPLWPKIARPSDSACGACCVVALCVVTFRDD